MESIRKPAKKESVFRNATERADLRNNIALSNYIQDNYTKPPPELEEIVSDIPHLSKLAENIHNLMATASETPLSRESAELCELGMRHLLNEFKTMKETAIQADSSLGKAKKLVDYAALLAQNPSDITLAKLQIIELQRENQELNNKLNDFKNEIQNIQDENDKMSNEIVKRKNELQRQANNHKDEVSKMKYDYEQLDNLRQSAVDKSKLDVEEINRLKKQLLESRDEAEANEKELDAAKERLKQKNDMISKLRTELKKKEFELQEFQIKKEQDEMNASSEFLTQTRLLEDKNQTALRKLARHIQAQAKEIELLKNANYKATEVIGKQNVLLDKFEDEMANTQFNNDDLNGQLVSTREINEMMQEEIATTQEQLAKANDELSVLRDIIDRSVTNLAPAYVVTQDQLPDICHELAGTRIDPETARVLQRLNSIADALSMFIIKLLRDGTADLEFLKLDPIKIKQPQRSDILSSIEEIRIFLDTISFQSSEEDKVVSYLLHPEENFNFDEDADRSLSAVLTEILTRFREFTAGMIDELNTVRTVLPAFDCKDYELPGAVAEYINQLQPVFQQLLEVIGSTLHFHGDINDIFACLCKYIEESSNMINILDNGARPLIGFNGKIVDIAPRLVEVLAEYKEIVENQDTIQKRQLTESLIAADRDRASYERQIDELNENMVKKERLNTSLQKQLEKVAADLQDARNHIEDLTAQITESDKTNENLSMQNKTSKEAIELLQKHNTRLENTLKERTASYEKRLKDALEQERTMTSETSDREKRRYEEQQLILERKITELNKKLQAEKTKVASTIQLYNEQSQQFQEERRKMSLERSDLSTTIENLRDTPESQAQIEKLQQKLTDAKMKNRELAAEVSRLNGSTQASLNETYSPSGIRSRSINGASLSRSSIKEESQFVEQLGSILSRFLQKDVNWNRPRVLKTVEALTQRVELFEKNKEGKQGEWTRWADDLLKHVKPKYIGGITDSEMRQQIGDISIAAGNRTKLIDMIQILRDEKQTLLKITELQKADEQPSMRALSLAALFVSIIQNNNRNSVSTRSIKTPASPAAIKSTLSLLK